MYCIRNGELMDENQPVINVFDRGFLLADGLFETILFKQSEPACWQGHMDRLCEGLQAMAIKFDVSPEKQLAHCLDVLTANHLMTSTAAVRITVTRGVGSRGVSISGDEKPTFLIQAAEYLAPTTPVRLAINTQCRRIATPLSRYKTLDYTLNTHARYQAQQNGFDDAILLNEKNELVCTTTANIFLEIDGILVTSPLSAGAVAGIERARVLRHCKAHKLPYAVRPIPYEEALLSTAGFITNSLIGRQPISLIEDNGLDVSHVGG